MLKPNSFHLAIPVRRRSLESARAIGSDARVRSFSSLLTGVKSLLMFFLWLVFPGAQPLSSNAELQGAARIYGALTQTKRCLCFAHTRLMRSEIALRLDAAFCHANHFVAKRAKALLVFSLTRGSAAVAHFQI